MKIIKIYKKNQYEYLGLIFYITWRLSSYELFARILNIMGVKLKQNEDIFQGKFIFNRTLSSTHFQNITRHLHHQSKYSCTDNSILHQFHRDSFTQQLY